MHTNTPMHRYIHSHKATCHHTDTHTNARNWQKNIFEKMYEIQIIVRSNLLEHELILKMYFVCMDVFEYMHVYRVYAVPMEARRGLQMS